MEASFWYNIGMETKICSKCDIEKPLNEYRRDRSKKSGYMGVCKACKAEPSSRWYRNKAATDPEWLEKERARQRVKWTRYSACPKNKDKIKAKCIKRKNLLKDVECEVVDRGKVFERDGGICYLCLEPVDPDDWHMDHVHPLSKTGPHTYANVRVTHPRCNLTKSNKLL